LAAMGEALLDRAASDAALPMPGLSHTQPAAVTSLGHLWAAHAQAVERDLDALRALEPFADQSPLGAAAGFGSTWPIDRAAAAAHMGFASAQTNSLDCVTSRGELETRFAAALSCAMNRLSVLAQDLIVLSSPPRRYIELSDAHVTGSSIMPQKRNPDVLELVRASVATVKACLDESLMITAKLPSGYQRDLQRLKPPLFRGVDLPIESVDVMSCLVSGLHFIEQNIAMDDALNAATEANELVTSEGIPFREAYRRIAAKYVSK